MRVVFVVGHPKDVHTFKYVYSMLVSKGHTSIVVCNNRQYNVELLKHYHIEHYCISKHAKSLFGKAIVLALEIVRFYVISVKFHPDLYVSHSSVSLGIVSRVFGRPHIAVEDTFNMEQVRLSMLFTDVVLTGDYHHPGLGAKEVRYPGYHELAYLHPKVFTPDDSILVKLGVEKGEKYAIVRFVAWAATHDIGHKGMSPHNKMKLVESLAKHARVFISSEDDLPLELIKYRIQIEPVEMHNALAFAHIFVGESSTMATESALLGVPAIYVNDSQLGYIRDIESSGLIYSYTESDDDQESAIRKASEIVQSNDNTKYRDLRNQLLCNKVDLSSFLFWFLTNYPDSKQEMDHSLIFNFERFK